MEGSLDIRRKRGVVGSICLGIGYGDIFFFLLGGEGVGGVYSIFCRRVVVFFNVMTLY